ncbi:MAG: hypothetical protein ABFD83_05760 [Armatimonadota bacterium]
MKRFILDSAIAVWIVVMGAFFVLSPFMELRVAGRCVYIVALVAGVASASLSVMRAISYKMCGRSED